MKDGIFVGLCFILLSLACGLDKDQQVETKEFFNTLWTLEAFDIEGSILKPPKDQLYTIQFKVEGTFSGVNDCNDFGGEYEVESDSSIVILKVGGSKVNCPNSVFLDYLEAFRDATLYKIHKNYLYIYYGDNSRLIFYSD